MQVMNALQRHATAAHVQTSGLILVGHLTDRPGDDLPSISLGQVQKVAQSALKQHVVTQEVCVLQATIIQLSGSVQVHRYYHPLQHVYGVVSVIFGVA